MDPVELPEDRLRLVVTEESSNGLDHEPYIVGGRRSERQRFRLQGFAPEFDESRCVRRAKLSNVEFHPSQPA